MLAQVIEYLNQKGWVYSTNNEGEYVTFSLSGANGIFHSIIRVREEISIIYFVTYFGLNCPQDRRPDMAQLLSHLNSNLIYGNFEMDIFEGSIKSRTGLCYENVDLNFTVIDNLIIRNIYSMDICSVEFSKFINNKATISEIYSRLYPNTDKLIEEAKMLESEENTLNE